MKPEHSETKTGLGLITDFWSRSRSRSRTLWSRSWSHYVPVSLTSLQETRNIALSYGVDILTDNYFDLSQIMQTGEILPTL